MKSKVSLSLVLMLYAILYSHAQSAPPMKELGANSYECGFCEFLIVTIYTYLTQSSTETQISHVVSQICSYLPENDREFCEQIIATYGPEIIELLVQRLPASVVCADIGFCNATAAITPLNQSPQCAMCQFLSALRELHLDIEEGCRVIPKEKEEMVRLRE